MSFARGVFGGMSETETKAQWVGSRWETGKQGRADGSPGGVGLSWRQGTSWSWQTLALVLILKHTHSFFFTSVCAVGIKRPDSGARQLGFEPHLCPLLV